MESVEGQAALWRAAPWRESFWHTALHSVDHPPSFPPLRLPLSYESTAAFAAAIQTPSSGGNRRCIRRCARNARGDPGDVVSLGWVDWHFERLYGQHGLRSGSALSRRGMCALAEIAKSSPRREFNGEVINRMFFFRFMFSSLTGQNSHAFACKYKLLCLHAQ